MNIVSASQKRYRCVLRFRTLYDSSKNSPNRAFGNTVNQLLLDALLCFSLVVVPMARCFSRDSYAGSVMSRSKDSAGCPRSHSTASLTATSNRDGFTYASREMDEIGGVILR